MVSDSVLQRKTLYATGILVHIVTAGSVIERTSRVATIADFDLPVFLTGVSCTVWVILCGWRSIVDWSTAEGKPVGIESVVILTLASFVMTVAGVVHFGMATASCVLGIIVVAAWCTPLTAAIVNTVAAVAGASVICAREGVFVGVILLPGSCRRGCAASGIGS